ncbi:hybrid sensor histidine kinase/response regulator [Caenimonas koreensis]|uniref:hybrid sensor histidine kinase/response regulator n=1 Tax=Caenimonas koreensis TaxID=367474 RepID=UPI002B26964B|nr:response regulator [Caenimonas koreensis]
MLGTAEALQDRLYDAVNGKSLEQLRADQASLHELLQAATKDQPQIQSVWIIGADGKPVASSRFMPVPALDFNDREYFQFHRDGQPGRFVSPPFNTRTTNERVLDISRRFDSVGGKFGGVINISLRTAYFEQFYSDLVDDEPGLAVNLFRRDGSIYTRWPPVPGAPDKLGANSPAMTLVRAGNQAGQTRGWSSVDGQDRLIAFRQVAAYPLFAGTGMNLSTLRGELLKELAIMLALGIPPFAALFFTSRVALRRTRESIDAARSLESETLTRQRAEEALFQAQKLEAMGRLTGGVAHDFNNALMVISNNAFLLRRIVNEAGITRLDSIGRAVDSATKLTRQLLAFSRRQPLLPERVQLQARLPSLAELIGPVLGGQIKLSITVADDTAAIEVDPAELELALLNLGINARDAMPSGGVFMIEARNARPDESQGSNRPLVVIDAIDTGTGIDPAVIAKVFEPFFTTKPVGHGTGLGLSQVYGLCQRAGGFATIESTPGAGTTVRLFFPAKAASEGDAIASATPIARDLRKRILLVEDNSEVAGALLPLLEAFGCTVTRVASAVEARDWLEAQDRQPDLVLSDVVMPGEIDGLGLARFLRQRQPKLRVILMTGYAQHIDAIAGEGFEVLPKPCAPDVLGAAIARD